MFPKRHSAVLTGVKPLVLTARLHFPAAKTGAALAENGAQRKALLADAVTRPPIFSSTQSRKLDVCRTAPSEVSYEVPPAAHENGPVDSSLYTSLTDIWHSCSVRHGDVVAVCDPYRDPAVQLTYRELKTEIECFACGLHAAGLCSKEAVAFFAENSSRWIVADQAVMMNAAIDAVRGAGAPLIELQQIVLNSDSVGLILHDDEVLKKLLHDRVSVVPGHPNGVEVNQKMFSEVMNDRIKFAVLLWGESSIDPSAANFPVYTYDQLMALGRSLYTTGILPFSRSSPEDIATIVYTSGTSGTPKGVELTHGNILYQIHSLRSVMHLKASDQVVSLLPPWHIYERTAGYYIFNCGCRVVYSSVKTLKRDLATHRPYAFVTVPLVLDTLYKRVQAQMRSASLVRRTIGMSLLKASMLHTTAQRVANGLDLRYACVPLPFGEFLKALILSWILTPLQLLARLIVHRRIKAALGIESVIISGGGSLAGHLDLFFESIGMPLLNGWGLTETSPVLCCRLNENRRNVRGSVGYPIDGTEVRVVDPVTLENVPDGTVGLVLVRGPGVMRGYHKDPAETNRVLMKDGWFNTGDRGWRAPSGVPGSHMAGNVVLTGRAKDTIVLRSGENIEPQPIEDWLQVSPLISHIMLIGQDHRSLGALVVPEKDAVDVASKQSTTDQIFQEIKKLEKQNPNFVPNMRIAAIQVLEHPFSVEDGTLTKTMKIRRSVIMEKYADDVALLEEKIR